MGTSISQILVVTTPPLGVAPGPATSLTLSNISTTSITLSWTAPTTGSLPLSYRPQVSVSGSGVWTPYGSGSIATTTVSITGLTVATSYLFEIVTSNGSGNSTSASVAATTLAVAPGAPTGLAVVSVAQSSVSLQWVAPALGTPPLTYQVSSSTPSGSNSFVPFTSTTTALTQTISGLSPGTSYDFVVAASNSAGGGATSAVLANVVTSSPTQVAPSAPTNLTAGTITSTTIPVSWTASATGSTPISYVVQYRLH